jgi:release factor glutamine methyltransferase
MKSARSLLQLTRSHAEADIILAALLDLPRSRLYTDDITVPRAIEEKLFQLLAKRQTHTPLQYLTRTGYFMDLQLFVDERTFIPRPETEELVERIFSRLPHAALIFDIGTGSAAIAIALALHYRPAKVIATDISEPALAVARLNIARHDLNDRITVHRASVFNFPDNERYRHRVDLIVSNPPYIRTDAIPGLMAEVRDYEPRIALDGGPDGLQIMKPLIERAADFLKPTGLLALEIDPGLVPSIEAIAPAPPVFEHDLFGHDRFMFLQPARNSEGRNAPASPDTYPGRDR